MRADVSFLGRVPEFLIRVFSYQDTQERLQWQLLVVPITSLTTATLLAKHMA